MNPLLLSAVLAFAQPVTASSPATAPSRSEVAQPAPPSTPSAREPNIEKSAGWNEETLLDFTEGGELTYGGFGGPEVRFSQIAGSDAVFAGGRGGMIVNHSLIIGGGGFGGTLKLKDPIRIVDTQTSLVTEYTRLNIGYGGLLLDYVLWPEKVVHVALGGLIGAGGINPGEPERDHHDGDVHGGDTIFVMEPELFIEVNLTKWFRLAAGGTYRIVTGVTRYGLENEDLRGASGALLLKFGNF